MIPLWNHKHKQKKKKKKCCAYSLPALLGLPVDALMTLFHISSYLCRLLLLLQNLYNLFSSAFLMPAKVTQPHSKWELAMENLFWPWTYCCAVLASCSRAEFLQPNWFPLRATHPHLIPRNWNSFFLVFKKKISSLNSFLLNWPSLKIDWHFQWALPYWCVFQIDQLPTHCRPQLPSDPVHRQEKKLIFRKMEVISW